MKINHPLSVDTWDKKNFQLFLMCSKANSLLKGKYVKKFEKNIQIILEQNILLW